MAAEMEYRRVGKAGLKLSVLGFGSWVTFGTQLGTETAAACMAAAYERGVNFFDNAESYAGGESERIMGRVLKELGWPRYSYVISTKFYWGLHDNVNTRDTLNRKYLLEAIDPSLERLGLDHVDLVYCHRADPDTPVEETAWAMHDIVASGRAHYWGTSEWPAEAIEEAHAIAERDRLHTPIVEQPEYNLLHRRRVEVEYAPLYSKFGIGLTTFSPLASGILTGKYLDSIPDGSRASVPGYGFVRQAIDDPQNTEKVRRFVAIARGVGCTPGQLAIAWCASNENASSVITGASRVEQVEENLAAIDVLELLDSDLLGRLEEIFAI
jgi:voltage-dependent potassium channel beta subunit